MKQGGFAFFDIMAASLFGTPLDMFAVYLEFLSLLIFSETPKMV